MHVEGRRVCQTGDGAIVEALYKYIPHICLLVENPVFVNVMENL